MRSLCRANRGFTITELTIAAALALVVLIGIGVFLTTAIKSQSSAALRDSDAQQSRTLSEWFADHIPAARTPLRQVGNYQLEFAANWNGQLRYFTVWADCANDPKTVRVLERTAAQGPRAGEYPPVEDPDTPDAGDTRQLATLKDCAQPLFSYYDGADGSEPFPSSATLARAAETESLIVQGTLTNGGRFRLDNAVGLLTEADPLTPIPNGGFEHWDGSPAADGWTLSGTGTATLSDEDLADSGEHALTLTTNAADASVAVTSATFIAQGDTIQVRARPDSDLAADSCRVSVLNADGEVLYAATADPPLTPGEYGLINVPMLSQAGQPRQLKLQTNGDAGQSCRFDAVVSKSG